MKLLAEDGSNKRNEILEEGIKFFKTSNKIQNAINKAKSSFEKNKEKLNSEDAKKVQSIIKRMEMAKKEFADVENTYSTGAGKDIVKRKFKILKIKYADIYRDITMIRNVLVGSGMFLALGTSAFLLLRFVFPDVAPDLVGIPKDEQLSNRVHKIFNDGAKEVNTTSQGIGIFFDKFKKNPKGVFSDIESTFSDKIDSFKNKQSFDLTNQE